jgi:hypothetical protein
LSAYRGGRASFQSLKADLAVLISREWLARMQVLDVKAGPVSLFTDGLAVREQSGWAITDVGYAFLNALEQDRPTDHSDKRPVLRVVASNPPKLVKAAAHRLTDTPEQVAS